MIPAAIVRAWRLLAVLAVLEVFALPGSAAESTRSVTDDTGESVTVPVDACRIVSLAPGTTAMLFAAGAERCIVGTIAHSDEPAAAARIPVVGDAETLDFERVVALRPTVVVSAVDVVQRARIDRLRSMGLPIYQVHVTRLAAMPDAVRRLGELAGTDAAAGASATALEAKLAAISARYRSRAPVRVLYQIWDRPIYTIGGHHVITDALKLCGGVNIFADLDTAAPAVTREAAILRNPQVIIVSAPPGAGTEWAAEWRKTPALDAVRNHRVFEYTDARIDRMGPSVVDATESLCEVVDRARAHLEP